MKDFPMSNPLKEAVGRLFGVRPVRASKDEAKQRLKILLIHDQVDLTPAQMDAMKAEILAVIGKYVEFDPDHTEVRLERGENAIAVVSSVPVRRTLERTRPAAQAGPTEPVPA